MNLLKQNKYIFQLLFNSDRKLRNAILKYAPNKIIEIIHEIIHNLLVGILPLSDTQLSSLKQFKTQLRNIHRLCQQQKCIKKKRQIFLKQYSKKNSTALITALQYAFDTILKDYSHSNDNNKKKKEEQNELQE